MPNPPIGGFGILTCGWERAIRRASRAAFPARRPSSLWGLTPRPGAGSLKAVNDAALRPVCGADFQQHAIVLDYADVVFRHPSRHPRKDFMPIGEYHGIEAVSTHPGDSTLGLNEISSRHLAILLIALAAASHRLPRERAPALPRPGLIAGHAPDLKSPGKPLSQSRPCMPSVSASQLNSFSPCPD